MHATAPLTQKVTPNVTQFAKLNVANARETTNKRYAIQNNKATDLYGHNKAAKPRPVTRFSEANTGFSNYPVKYASSDSKKKKLEYDSDCGEYARSLVAEGRKKPVAYKHKLLAATADPKIGNAYFIAPAHRGTNASAVAAGTAAPWDLTKSVVKGATNFHVATVVAKDSTDDVITSEVNAAFQSQKTPWFSMYAGGGGFFNTFRMEYQSFPGGIPTDPVVYDYSL